MAHQSMLDAITDSVRRSASYTGRSSLSPAVMDAMAQVPRAAYVPSTQRALAYENYPLPIGEGQTISQPLIVALMTDLIEPQAHHVVLEVGTGSGYQAAVLAHLVKQVYSVEIIPELAERAARTLKEQGVHNVAVKQGDGYAGWPEHAPFDAIVVTAAPEDIPPPLMEQLRPGGKLVIPVGPQGGVQELLLVTADASGSMNERSVLPVSFVPLTGER